MIYMLQDYESAKSVLKKYNQEHLLNFYDELNNEEKLALINQIFHIDLFVSLVLLFF